MHGMMDMDHGHDHGDMDMGDGQCSMNVSVFLLICSGSSASDGGKWSSPLLATTYCPPSSSG